MLKLNIFLAALLFILIPAAACAQRTAALPGGYAVSIPEGFSPECSNTPDAQTFVDRESIMVLSIVSIDLDDEDTALVDLESEVMSRLKQRFSEFQISYNETEEINNMDVYVIYGKAVMDGTAISLVLYFYDIDGFAYSLVCACLEEDVEKNADLFDGIAASLVKQ